MSQPSGPGARTWRLGAAVTAAVVAAVSVPAVALAQDDPTPGAGSTLPETGVSSVDQLIGQLPDEIVIGGGGLGSEALRDTGSAPVVDGAQSVGEVVGSVAPLEAVGVAGGSAAASVASSGSLPGSVYVNPTGSVGSGTIGLGSIAIPEYIFPVLSLQFAGGYFAALDERQDAGELYPHELDFWHGLVEGSAEGGALLTDAAAAAGTELPGGLAGSIEAVQIAALQDPYEDNERRRAEAQAAAEAEAAGQTQEDEDASGAADGAPGATTGGDDDDELPATPAGANGPAAEAGVGTGAGGRTLDAAAAPAPAHAAAADTTSGPAGQSATAALAVTGVRTATVAGLAAGTVLLGVLLLAASRRRA
ncbi:MULTISPECIES: hypothetical protein [Dietzia]|uniref:Gram-positive cocci surface proteins LPxTG domain-containing protein n=2 Tax=Dietzia TaxID=37914 RepID=A0AAW5Q314_9ACTN|nr:MULTISPECIES: hypothetical protein [Dietzia]MCT1863831.1 hypothetical protein [Dietzia cinnamea]MCT2030116.1 hypothetical protein [Dietzia cinnamea]MCT2034100.1 hypothetical protein [Dietzia cinnamea]MCT2058307.1 hypothetical protein [Dietzia cinnamea]MCT2060393.1 hypothetical protein [Dietzia cinnamea]